MMRKKTCSETLHIIAGDQDTYNLESNMMKGEAAPLPNIYNKNPPQFHPPLDEVQEYEFTGLSIKDASTRLNTFGYILLKF